MDMSLMQLRDHLQFAGDAFDVKNTRITTSELLASCGESTPYALRTYPVSSCCRSHATTSSDNRRYVSYWVLDSSRFPSFVTTISQAGCCSWDNCRWFTASSRLASPQGAESSEEEQPQVGPEPSDDPYDNDQGDWPDTAEPEEHKMSVVVAPRLGHPPGTGWGSSKRSRGRWCVVYTITHNDIEFVCDRGRSHRTTVFTRISVWCHYDQWHSSYIFKFNMLGIACTYLNLNMSDITLSFRFTPPLDVHFKPSIINHRTTSRWHSYDSPTLVLSV